MSIESVKCPQCAGPMASRANRQTGQRFWGCKRYPDCKGTLNTDGEARSSRADWSSERDDEPDTRLPSQRRTQRGWE